MGTYRSNMNFFPQNLNILRNKRYINNNNNNFSACETLNVKVYDNFTFFFLRYIVYFRRITVHQCKCCILIGSATTRKDGKTKKRHRSLSELKILEVAVEKNDKHAYMIASFQMVKCCGMCYLI